MDRVPDPVNKRLQLDSTVETKKSNFLASKLQYIFGFHEGLPSSRKARHGEHLTLNNIKFLHFVPFLKAMLVFLDSDHGPIESGPIPDLDAKKLIQVVIPVPMIVSDPGSLRDG